MNATDVPVNPPPEVIEAFRSAAVTALQELTQLEASFELVAAAANSESSTLVTATVRLARKVPGTMKLVLTEASASILAARYLPQETQLTAEIVDDVAGEFANVIAGQAKTILKGTPYHYTLTTPIVTRHPPGPQLPTIEPRVLIARVTFESGSLLLLVDLSECPGA
jgi:CheY-specific phosphatase CheX